MKKRALLLVGAAALLPAQIVRANLTGFSGFAPINNPGSTPGLGYSIDGSTYTITTANNGIESSGFSPTPQDDTAFTAVFNYTSIPGYQSGSSTIAADGITMAFQSATTGVTTALGAGGGSLGYNGSAAGYANFNTSTFALEINDFGGFYNFGGSYNTASNGGNPADIGFAYGVNLSNKDPLTVTLKYSGTTLRSTFVDLTTHAAYVSTQTGINIASTLGSTSAIVGFTGSTGGYNALQSVSNFSYTSNVATAALVYAPIITTGGFNNGIVVPLSAAVTTPTAPFTTLTATMDGGTAKSGYTFYETGYNTAALTTGLPTSGATFVSQTDPTHSFKMQTYGLGSDVMLLNASTTSGTFTLPTPTAYSGLSFLASDGGGDSEFSVTLHFANGSTEVDDGNVAPDWFQPGVVAWNASGRVNSTNGYSAVSSANPDLFQVDVTPTDTTDPISSITVTYENEGQGSNLGIYAVSGAPTLVPEPASLALIGVAGAGLLRRRRAL